MPGSMANQLDTSPRIVTVWCPDWPVTAAGIASHVPAAVFHANRVVARSPSASQAGVRLGDRRRVAQRTCPELLIIAEDPARDAREFEPLIRAVGDLAPRIDVVEPGWLCLAARGPSRYFGGDHAFVQQLMQMLAALVSTPIGVGVADGRTASAIAARQSARHRVPRVVEPGRSPQFVSELSVGWLRELREVSADVVDLFNRLGIRSLGDLAALPPADVLARFGTLGLHAHRLASGLDERPPDADDPPLERSVERVFEHPVEHLEMVVFVAKQLGDELFESLAGEGRVCTRMVVLIETEHGERCERAWYREGGLSASAMIERVRWQLEGWASQPGGLTGGIELLRLVPDEVCGDNGSQLGLWGGRTQADHQAHRAITRLTGLAGEQAVCVPEWRGGRLPAERYRLVPAVSVDLDDPWKRLSPGDGPWPGASPLPAPAIVPVHDVPVELVDRSGVSLRIGGRGEISAEPSELVVGRTRRSIVDWAGPWLLDQRWWDAGSHRRMARMQLVSSDDTAFLVAVEQQQWWLLAEYR